MGVFQTFRAKLFIVMVLVATVPIALGGTYAYIRISAHLEEMALSEAEGRLAAAAREVRGFLDLVRADVLYLSRFPSLRMLVETPSSEGEPSRRDIKEQLEQEMLSFAAGRTEYCQIRYIDETGQETVRVDYEVGEHRVVPDDLLQLKNDRYYFREIMQLSRGEVYASPVDLNRERGIIERPFNPVARYGTPVFDAQGRNRGTVIINVGLGDRIRRTAALIAAGRGQVFVADQDGYYLWHSDARRAWGGPRDLDTGHGLEEDIPWFRGPVTVGDLHRARQGQDMLVYIALHADENDASRYLILGHVRNLSEVLAPVAAFRELFFILIAASLCITVALALALARRVSGPVRSLQHGAERIGRGDLQHRIHVASKDELGALAASFNRMAADLAGYIEHVRESTAARERWESDLRVARQIQESILPDPLLSSPEGRNVAFRGKSVPAREVGGDLYEFFFRDERTLVLAAGDVSGKGVPAALLMAMTWVLLRTHALQEDSPAAVLKQMNRALLQATGPSRFITMFLAFHDTQSNLLTFANAGHCLPVVARSDGSAEMLKSTGMVLGVLDELEVEDEQIQLHPGDRLVVYSDGVTEALDAGGEQFGTDRLKELVVNSAHVDLGALIEILLKSVQSHQATQTPLDDITVGVLEAK